MSNTFIIAEAGVNHNGDLSRARELVEVAAACGADAIKFQTFRAQNLVSRSAQKADYQTRTTSSDESQWEMLRRLELDENAHKVLAGDCAARGIEFLSTPFDIESLQLLQSLEVARVKLPSGEITNAPLLLATARGGHRVILSTGMSTLGDVENALGVLAFGYTQKDQSPSLQAFAESYASPEGQSALREKVTLLHCTTEYPAPFEDVNLKAMDTLRAAFGLSVGFSDHTPGLAAAIGAVARGATMIEKHFTLDRNLPGPDHKASLEPDELRALVQSIREIETALGSPLKAPAPSELKNIAIARKSLVAARKVEKGEIWCEENLTAKRPGGGISPLHFWEFLGEKAERNYTPDEML